MADYFKGDSDSEDKESKSTKDLLDLDPEEVLDLCIDQALSGCCDPDKRREHFRRAVGLIVEDLLNK